MSGQGYQEIVDSHPNWSRHRITKMICDHWKWRTQTGQLKTFSARSMIDKLEQRGYINLPPVRITLRRTLRPPFPNDFVPPVIHPVSEKLKYLILNLQTGSKIPLFRFCRNPHRIGVICFACSCYLLLPDFIAPLIFYVRKKFSSSSLYTK